MLAYAKPKITMLDDDSSLLDVMEYYFSEQFHELAHLKFFLKSSDLLTYIEENCYLPESPIDILNTFYAGNKNKEHIYKVLKDLSELPSIIVLDHELRGEEINGIDLSKIIREYFPTSYLCMLTSNVPTTTAIELHNNHNIDLFIDKKEPDSIHHLYTYLEKQLNSIKNEFSFDSIDIFSQCNELEDVEYLKNKEIFLKEINPLCFLTINEKGNIALMQENKNISFWQFNPTLKKFTQYE